MKLLLLIAFLVTCCLSFGQRFRDIDESLNQFIITNVKNDSAMVWLKNIISHRDTSYLKKHFESIPAQNIKIVEVFDRNTNMYGIKENFAINNKIEFIYRDKSEDTIYNSLNSMYKYSFENMETLKSNIIYFPPNSVEAFCGCGQVPKKIKRTCLKDAERKAKKDGYIAENFAKLITYIDKTNGKIVFIVEIPSLGKRSVSCGNFPDINNRTWYE